MPRYYFRHIYIIIGRSAKHDDICGFFIYARTLAYHHRNFSNYEYFDELFHHHDSNTTATDAAFIDNFKFHSSPPNTTILTAFFSDGLNLIDFDAGLRRQIYLRMLTYAAASSRYIRCLSLLSTALYFDSRQMPLKQSQRSLTYSTQHDTAVRHVPCQFAWADATLCYTALPRLREREISVSTSIVFKAISGRRYSPLSRSSLHFSLRRYLRQSNEGDAVELSLPRR